MKRPRPELLTEITKQLTWLERSAAAYDGGAVDEAIRMSVPLRTLFHDTNHSTSLLTQLGVKRTVQILSTATPVSPTASIWAGITALRFSIDPAFAEYVPKLDEADRNAFIPVHPWWTDEVVYFVKPTGIDVRRRDLVLWAAHKDGGAHVDVKPAPYQWLEAGAGVSITLNPDNGPERTLSFEGAHLAALRQITDEVLNSPGLRNLT